MQQAEIIPPRSGVAFLWKKDHYLEIIDPEGEQVADLICFNASDPEEYLSSGRTIDYAETIFLTKGHPFYSNRSRIFFDMLEDSVGRHDFILTPCSADTFRILYNDPAPHRGCFGNLVAALEPFGIKPDQIPVTFNVFMNTAVDGDTGKIEVKPPVSKPGDRVLLKARMDLITGLTACSAGMSNNFQFKPIAYRLLAPDSVKQ